MPRAYGVTEEGSHSLRHLTSQQGKLAVIAAQSEVVFVHGLTGIVKGYLKEPGQSRVTAAVSLLPSSCNNSRVHCCMLTCVLTQLNQLCSRQGQVARTHGGRLVCLPMACDGHVTSCDQMDEVIIM